MVSDAYAYYTPWGDLVSTGQIFPLAGMFFGFFLILVLCFGALTIAFVKALRGGGSTRRLREFEARDAHTFQDLQRGFKRMEERIDSLETLFIGASPTHTFDREFD